MPFELKQSPWHPEFGYNSPHLPLGTDPVTAEINVSEVEPIFDWDVEESGDEHTFSETVEPEHEESVVESTDDDKPTDDAEAFAAEVTAAE